MEKSDYDYIRKLEKERDDLRAENAALLETNIIVALQEANRVLADERDGFRNGQEQIQSICSGLHDSIDKYAAERKVLIDRLKPIEAVWEQFRHLDVILSGEKVTYARTPMRRCLYDVWWAVKKSNEGRVSV